MMALVFIIFLAALLCAWKGYRQVTLGIFSVAILLAIFVFLQDITSPLTLQL